MGRSFAEAIAHRVTGDGSSSERVEREAIKVAFDSYVRDQSQWFLPRLDGHSSIAATASMLSPASVSSTRKRHLSILGALAALLLIHGLPCSPIDPVLLQFFVHWCDLRSIHPMFLGLWHPSLRQLLSDWISVGPAGDIARFQGHFASFHDIQVIMILYLPWWSLIHLQHNSWHPYAIATNLSIRL